MHKGDRHNAVFGKVFPHHERQFFNITPAPAPMVSPKPSMDITPALPSSPSIIKTETTPTSSTTTKTTTMGHHGHGHHGHHGGGGGFGGWGWGGYYPYPYYPAETVILDTPALAKKDDKKTEPATPASKTGGGITTNALIGGAVGGTLGYLLAKQLGQSGIAGAVIGALGLGWAVSSMKK